MVFEFFIAISNTAAPAEYVRLTALPCWVRMGEISGAPTIERAIDGAMKVVR
jgi:hypothetical protein